MNQSKNSRIRLIAVGDILLGRGVGTMIKRNGPDYPLKAVSTVLKTGDITIANLECPATKKGRPVTKPITFNSDPQSLGALKKAGISMVSLSNNHALDYGRTGLLETMKYLRQHNIPFFGAGHNAYEAHRPLIIQKNGLKIAFFSYNAHPYEGVAYDQKRANIALARKKSVIHHDIGLIRKKVDLVIVCFHWGREFRPLPTALQRTLARITIDAGADLIIGHHPHVLQPPRYYRGKLILFSLGNFVFDQTDPKQTESVIFSCDLSSKGVSNVKFTPVRIHNCQPRLATNSGLS
ncbi:MAG: CapA family protein [Candidatus Saccharibacteria bacterium]